MANNQLSPNDVEISFSDFLKQHSSIEEKFIDDFFENVNKINVNDYNKCVINLNKLVKWMEINDKGKEKIITRINKIYRVNDDYIIKYKMVKKQLHKPET